MSDSDVAPRVLVVCTGNLCRSPIAEALLVRGLADAGIKVEVTSAGTDAPANVAPDRKALRVAEELGLDVSGHLSKPVTRDDLRDADLVITLTTEQSRQVESIAPDASARTVTLRVAAWKAQIMRGRDLPFDEWVARLAAGVPVAERVEYEPNNDIADPTGGSLREYRAMVEEVDALVATLVARWSGR